MKRIFVSVLVAALVLLSGATMAQQTQPPVLDTPVQYNPLNSRVVSGAGGTATVTITGVAGQRVRIYWIAVQCNAAATNLIPTLVVTDVATGGILFNTSGGTFSDRTFPVGEYRWLPGLTSSLGSSVTVVGNTGGACSAQTFVHVQADQF